MRDECQQRLQDAELVIAELQEESHQRELKHEKDLVVRGACGASGRERGVGGLNDNITQSVLYCIAGSFCGRTFHDFVQSKILG